MNFRVASQVTVLALTVAGCSSVNLWPFSDDKERAAGNAEPPNATRYHCDGNKTFYVRPMYEGKSVWLILPDRQVRLDGTDSGKYSNGIAVLTTDGTNASLTDGPSISYANCSSLPKATAK